MGRRYSALAIICGILIPVFAFSVSFAIVMLTATGTSGIKAVKIGSTVVGILSVLSYIVAEICFRKSGYSESGLTLSYYLSFTFLLVAGFTFASYHGFTVEYGASVETLRTAFRTCFFNLGVFTAISAVIRLCMEFVRYIKKLKQ